MEQQLDLLLDQHPMVSVLICVLALVLLAFLPVRAWLRSRDEKLEVEELPRLNSYRPEPTPEDYEALRYSQQQDLEEGPRCLVCGAVATHCIPELVRARQSWLQRFFAMAPIYRRVVPEDGGGLNTLAHLLTLGAVTLKTAPVPDACKSHAHVADARVDLFIYKRIRERQAELNADIAVEAAAFEKETLVEQLRSDMTEKQRKGAAPKRMAQVRALPRRTGTNSEAPISGN